MGFKASEVVEPLDYDFEKYGPSGVTPEPSSDQIDEFRKRISELLGQMLDEAKERGQHEIPTGPLAQIQLVSDLLADGSNRPLERKLFEVVAAVCSDEPTVDQIDALPYRLKHAFVAHMSDKFLLPEVFRPATTV